MLFRSAGNADLEEFIHECDLLALLARAVDEVSNQATGLMHEISLERFTVARQCRNFTGLRWELHASTIAEVRSD